MEEKYSLLSTLSHELRTPMNAIVGVSKLLSEKLHGGEEEALLRSLDAATQNLLMTIDTIIDYDDALDGNLKLHRSNFNLTEMFEDIMNVARINSGSKDVKVIFDIDPLLPTMVYGDVTRIKQVFTFFFLNALKRTNNGYIVFSAEYADESRSSIRLSLDHTEIGLPIMNDIVKYLGSKLEYEDMEDGSIKVSCVLELPMIGPPKEWTEEVRQKAYVGWLLEDDKEAEYAVKLCQRAGIRSEKLSQAVQLILSNHEEDTVYLIADYEKYQSLKDVSELKDFGITLVCAIDYVQENNTNRNIFAIHKPFFFEDIRKLLNGENLSKGVETLLLKDTRILVVDDNAINLKVSVGLLSPYGATIDTATGGEEAIRMVNRTKYDLVFMDHMMPEVDGVEATKRIRQNESEYFASLPIVGLTANVMEGSKELLRESGMNDFLPKPIEIKELEDVLRKWIPLVKQGIQDRTVTVEKPKVKFENEDAFVHIDVKEGMNYVGQNADMYRTILREFEEAAGARESQLKELSDSEDVARFTIEIHSLKSLSKTIGAKELGRMSEDLERLGHARDIESIKAKIDPCLKELSDVKEEINRLVTNPVEDLPKLPLIRERVGDNLRDLYHAVNDFDFDTIEMSVRELGRYAFDDVVSDVYKELKDRADNIDYSGMREETLKMIAML